VRRTRSIKPNSPKRLSFIEGWPLQLTVQPVNSIAVQSKQVHGNLWAEALVIASGSEWDGPFSLTFA